VSLRERHVEQTRRCIIDAAFDLFSRRGFEVTTVDEIAEHAGVSRRTFFRHFPAKDAVVFHDADEHCRALVADLRERLADEPPYVALLAALRARADVVTTDRGRFLAKVAAEHVTLLEHHRGVVMLEFEDAAVEVIAAETGRPVDDPALRAGVAVLFGAFSSALRSWLLAGATEPFSAVLEAALAGTAEAVTSAR
jgi:TetR/AcrR family transcriptional regulator, regulator of mycofactocin system